jgi:hypothetical protein
LIFKQGNVAWFKFVFDGELIRETTRQRSLKVARQMEGKRRAQLANEAGQRRQKAIELACTPKEVTRCTECERWFNLSKAVTNSRNETFCGEQCLKTWAKRMTPMPTLADFIDLRFEPWVKSIFEKMSPKT